MTEQNWTEKVSDSTRSAQNQGQPETAALGSNGRRFPRGSVLPGTPFEGKVRAGEIRIHEDAGKLLLGPLCYLSVSQHTLLREGRKEYLPRSKLQDLTEGKREVSPLATGSQSNPS